MLFVLLDIIEKYGNGILCSCNACITPSGFQSREINHFCTGWLNTSPWMATSFFFKCLILFWLNNQKGALHIIFNLHIFKKRTCGEKYIHNRNCINILHGAYFIISTNGLQIVSIMSMHNWHQFNQISINAKYHPTTGHVSVGIFPSN